MNKQKIDTNETQSVSINSQFVSINKTNKQINIIVCPTTGGQFEVSVYPHETVSELGKKIARQLQTPQERLKLLFKEKLLFNGTMFENNIQNGSKIIITPALESGFSSTTQGTQQSIIQAIEGLSDTQIDDFLGGHAPLTLALRVSDHVMFVQLQLEQARANLLRLQNSKTSTKSRSNCLSKQLQCNHIRNEIENLNKKHANKTPGGNRDNSVALVRSSSRTPDLSAECVSGSRDSLSKSRAPVDSDHSCVQHESVLQETKTDRDMSGSSRRIIRTTSGKITSGIGSLSQQGSSGTGSRFLRHMQRLGRLCGGHRQCVAYSSPELASEVSSIVQAAKHADGSSHRRSAAKYMSRDSSSGSTRLQSIGASIDSVTTHGPGIFSGTFSGVLHPSIQDKDGRPKRDPQTVLQILTDLLTASSQHEGQSGNAGVFPHLIREHFVKNSSSLPNISLSSDVTPGTSNQSTKHPVLQRASKRSYPFAHDQRRSHKRSSSLPPWMPSPVPSQMRKMALLFSRSSASNSSSRRTEPVVCASSHPELEDPRHIIDTNFLRSHQVQSWCNAMCDRRFQKQFTLNASRINNKLNQENLNTCRKVHTLRQMMALKRKNREQRKQTSQPCANVAASTAENQLPRPDAAHSRKTSLELQIERKAEMKHDGGETVTV